MSKSHSQWFRNYPIPDPIYTLCNTIQVRLGAAASHLLEVNGVWRRMTCLKVNSASGQMGGRAREGDRY